MTNETRRPDPVGTNARLFLGCGLLAVLVVVLAVGLFYAYRAQSPALREITYSEALAQVQSGQAQRIVVQGDRARITRIDGTTEQVGLPDAGQALTQAVAERNRTDPGHLVGVQYEPQTPSPGVALSVLLSLLPLLLIIVLIVLAARAFTRHRPGDRYEALTRAADLRDRGVLTEEEFQREKRRILG